MERVVYDLSGLEGFREEVLEPLQSMFPFDIRSKEELRKHNFEAHENLVIYSDGFFDEEKSDAEIMAELRPWMESGLQLAYIAVPRESLNFESELKQLGVYLLLSSNVSPDSVIDFLSDVFRDIWTESSEEKTLQIEKDLTQTINENQKVEPISDEKPIENMCVVMSGAPGVGTTFIGLNLAASMPQHLHYVEAGLRPCLTTWLGAEDVEPTATLNPFLPAIEKGNLTVYTRDPFGQETVDLHQIANEISAWNAMTILDVHLQDYLASIDHSFASKTVHILVTTADLHRCRYLEGLRADVVVINRVSKTLPIDEEEFQRFWPDSMLVFVPYEPKQEIAIVQGQPVVGDSDAVISAMIQVIATIQGGEHIATAV